MKKKELEEESKKKELVEFKPKDNTMAGRLKSTREMIESNQLN